MEKLTWLHRELVILNLNASTSVEAITQLGNLLYKNGFVKDIYTEAVLKRELEFSTGLPTDEVGVAIPHTNVEHVIKPAIAVGISPTPIPFREMGNPEGDIIEVRAVFMLAIHDAKKVIQMLQRLVSLFQTPGLLRQVVESKDADTLIALLQDQIETETV